MSNPRFVLALTPLYSPAARRTERGLALAGLSQPPRSPARLSLSSALGPLCVGAFATRATGPRLQSRLCRGLDQRLGLEPAVPVLGGLYPRRRTCRRRGHWADGRLFGPFYWPLHRAVQRARRAVGREGARTAAFVVDRAGISALAWRVGFPMALARAQPSGPAPLHPVRHLDRRLWRLLLGRRPQRAVLLGARRAARLARGRCLGLSLALGPCSERADDSLPDRGPAHWPDPTEHYVHRQMGSQRAGAHFLSPCHPLAPSGQARSRAAGLARDCRAVRSRAPSRLPRAASKRSSRSWTSPC